MRSLVETIVLQTLKICLMKKLILLGLAVVAGFTACTKESFESQENGLPEQ